MKKDCPITNPTNDLVARIFNLRESIILLCWFVLIGYALTLNAQGFAERKVLILQSDDPRLSAGQWLSEKTNVKLPADAVVRIMSDSGEVSKIHGPYDGEISNAIENRGNSLSFIDELASVVFNRGKSKTDMGAYRNIGKTKGPPRYREAVVRVVVGEQGSYCIAPNQGVSFWRGTGPEKAIAVTISADIKMENTLTWPVGETELGVPDTIMQNKPRRLVLSAVADFGRTSARLRYGDYGETPAEQLNWYHKAGCHNQFESALVYYQTF